MQVLPAPLRYIFDTFIILNAVNGIDSLLRMQNNPFWKRKAHSKQNLSKTCGLQVDLHDTTLQNPQENLFSSITIS